MNKLTRLTSTLLLSSSFLFSSSLSFANPPNVGAVAPLNFNPLKPERLVLKNGAIVYFAEDHELPLFHFSLMMKTTPADEEAVKVGAAPFLSSVWRKGGTLKRSPNDLNQELEAMSAAVETSVGEEFATISLECLSKDIQKGLELASDVMLHPRFDGEQLSLQKDQELAVLRQKNDTPYSISRRAVRDIIYGKKHFYARNLTPTVIASINKADLVKLHHLLVSPEQSILAISGDFNKQELLKFLDIYFAEWKPIGRVLKPYDYALKNPDAGSNFLVEKEFNQSRIVFTQLGLTRHDPDEYALEVANTILGGSGPSRLFGQIRSRLGLAYMVGSFTMEFPGKGMTGVVCQTKVASTNAAIAAINKELKKSVTELPTAIEMTQAKDSLVNSFVFKFQSINTIVQEWANLEALGYPPDYLETYVSKIKAVTAADVLRVSKRFFSPDKMKLIVVGDSKKFDGHLDQFGTVTTIPLGTLE